MDLPAEEWLANFEAAKKMVIEFMQTTPSRRPQRQALLNMKALEKEFGKVCSDYLVELKDSEEIQVSNTIAHDVLFKLHPSSQGVQQMNKVHTFRFLNKCKDGKERQNRVAVYKIILNGRPPRFHNGLLNLTETQACLLSLRKLERVIELLAAKGEYLMTPLAKNIFCGSIDELYGELKEKFAVPYDIAHLLKVLNQSAYDGGENLKYSELHAVAAQTIASTACMRDRSSAENIIRKKVLSYLAAGKKVDIAMFEVFAKYTRQTDASIAEKLEDDGAAGGSIEADKEDATHDDLELPIRIFSCYICNETFPQENTKENTD